MKQILTKFTYITVLPVVATALGLWFRFVIDPWLGVTAPLSPIIVAILISAWYGGFTSGLIATVLGALLGSFFFIEPRGTLAVPETADQIRMAVLVLEGVVISALCGIVQHERISLASERSDCDKALSKYRALFDSIDEGFCIVEIKFNAANKATDYTFLEVNPAFECLTGIKNAPGQTMRSIAPNHENKWFEVFGDVALNGKSTRLEHEAAQFNRVYDVYAFRIDEPSKRRVAILFSDVTERKKTERALIESEERFRQIADNIPESFWMWDIEKGHCLFTNAATENIYGVPNEEVLKYDINKILSFIHPDDLETVIASMNRQLAGESTEEEFRMFRKGEIIWVSVHTIPIKDANGKVIRVAGTTTDITARKFIESERERLISELQILTTQHQLAKERADSANHAKSQFLANMSHEIRTPLTAISGFAQLLDREQLSKEESREFTATIRRNANLLTTLINDILDLSKVEAGKLVVERIKCHLPMLLADVKALLGQQAQEKNIRLSIRSVGLVPEIITTDPIRLKQILINIIGNAVKFTSHGSVHVTVCLEKSADEGSQILFEVKDTGRGMSEAQTKNLFQPFTQADESTTRVYGGTGLGLVLSRRLAEALGGALELSESVPDKGSTFLIRIDSGLYSGQVPVGYQWESTQQEARVTTTSHCLEGLRILIAEDAPDSRQLINHILQNGGATVELARDGEEAVQKAIAHHPDIVLMDIQMPKLDGLQATTRLREYGFTEPIIALTAHAMKEERDKSLRAGCNDHVSKPVNMKELLEKIIHHNIASRHEAIHRTKH